MEPKESSMGKTRKLLSLKIKKAEVHSLKALYHMLKGSYADRFQAKYGNIAKLLDVNVQVEAISALVQFYDPLRRCFLFRDFQLGPLLEEVEVIMGLPLRKYNPYMYRGNYPSPLTIANILKVSQRSLRLEESNGVKGLPRWYLEQRLASLAEQEDWGTFIDVLALAIYGLILFPSFDYNIVSLQSIDVFVAYLIRQEDPGPAILSDIYCSLYACHVWKKERVLCCLPLLFLWLVSKVVNKSVIERCPIEDFIKQRLEIKDKSAWVDLLVQLDEKKVRWYTRFHGGKPFIIQCGDFPNVPLVGTMGCISYNPILLQRQLGFPNKSIPEEDSLTPFETFYAKGLDMEKLRRVRISWGKIKKNNELKSQKLVTHDRYRNWIRQRVREVGLPFKPVEHPVIPSPTPDPRGNEEVQALKKEVAVLKLKNEQLEAQLEKTLQESSALKKRNANFEEASNQEYKRFKRTEDRFHKSLIMADEEAEILKNKIDGLVGERDRLLDILQETEEGFQRRLQEALKEHDDIRDLYHEQVATTEALGQENREHIRVTRWQFNIMVDLQDRLQKVVALSNGAIEDVPEYLKRAEKALVFGDAPSEVKEFITYCRNLIEKLRNEVKRRMRPTI